MHNQVFSASSGWLLVMDVMAARKLLAMASCDGMMKAAWDGGTTRDEGGKELHAKGKGW